MIRRLQRFIAIAQVIFRYRLISFIPVERLPLLLRLIALLIPKGNASDADRGERLRLALEQLGPVFIKFGQTLSTRKDLIPPDIADELCLLQDNVPPFPSNESIALIEKNLGQPIDTLFAQFSPEPLASASVAQVHSAVLHSNEEVVVKVIRPGIEKIIEDDLQLLEWIAILVTCFHPDGRRIKACELVKDYRHTIFDELNLRKEAANTTQLKRNFTDSPLLYVPKIYWDYCRENVMVAEKINGIPVSDIAALKKANIDIPQLSIRGVEIFFTQVFTHNFFHADMHPGNVFVSPHHPKSPSYIAIDCAIIGILSEDDQYYLARNLLAIFQQDYALVARLHVECGWVPPTTPIHEFEAAIRSVCEPIFEKPLGEISFAVTLLSLFQTARRFDMEIQPSLVLLQKTLFNIEGLGRQLYPELDLWATAMPFLENWLTERYSPTAIINRLKKRTPDWLEQLPTLPDRLLKSIDNHTSVSHIYQQQIDEQQRQLKKQQQERRQRFFAISALIGLLFLHHTVNFPTSSWQVLVTVIASITSLYFLLR